MSTRRRCFTVKAPLVLTSFFLPNSSLARITVQGDALFVVLINEPEHDITLLCSSYLLFPGSPELIVCSAKPCAHKYRRGEVTKNLINNLISSTLIGSHWQQFQRRFDKVDDGKTPRKPAPTTRMKRHPLHHVSPRTIHFSLVRSTHNSKT